MMTDDSSRELSGAVNQSPAPAPAPVLGAGARETILNECSKAVEALKIKHAGKDAGHGYYYNRTLDEAVAAIRALADTVTDTAQGQPEITKGARP